MAGTWQLARKHKMTHKERPEPYESLFRIQRALSGYVSYLAACDTNIVFTEYLLYEPILRVLKARKHDIKCEFSCADFIPKSKEGGDHKRIDFVFETGGMRVALEVKWPRNEMRNSAVSEDIFKLVEFKKHAANAKSFICVFGRHSHISKIDLSSNQFFEPKSLPPIFAEFTRTRFGCRILELKT